MYDPTIGRWISEDPIGFEAADVNLYRYAHNGPTRSSDPSGLSEWPLDRTQPQIGIVSDPYRRSENPPDPNCLGAALGMRVPVYWNYRPGFVPLGWREVPITQVTQMHTNARRFRDEIEILVAVVTMPGGENVLHAIWREPRINFDWYAKLGSFRDGGESLSTSGNWIRGITDYNAHFAWYFGDLCGPGHPPPVIRAFVVPRDAIRVVDNQLPATP